MLNAVQHKRQQAGGRANGHTHNRHSSNQCRNSADFRLRFLRSLLLLLSLRLLHTVSFVQPAFPIVPLGADMGIGWLNYPSQITHHASAIKWQHKKSFRYLTFFFASISGDSYISSALSSLRQEINISATQKQSGRFRYGNPRRAQRMNAMPWA